MKRRIFLLEKKKIILNEFVATRSMQFWFYHPTREEQQRLRSSCVFPRKDNLLNLHTATLSSQPQYYKHKSNKHANSNNNFITCTWSLTYSLTNLKRLLSQTTLTLPILSQHQRALPLQFHNTP